MIETTAEIIERLNRMDAARVEARTEAIDDCIAVVRNVQLADGYGMENLISRLEALKGSGEKAK